MSFGLLGIHANVSHGGVAELISTWKPPLVVVLDHSDVWRQVKARSPNTLLVGRVSQQSQPDFSQQSLDPVVAARGLCETILPWADRMGKTYDYWLGLDEPVIPSMDAMRRLADFEAERIRVLAVHGFRAAVGNFSVGCPELAFWAGFLPALEAAAENNGALSLHEHGWPTLDANSAFLSLRHRKVYGGDPDRDWEGLPAAMHNLPLLITACGLDGGSAPGPPGRGWRDLCGVEAYLRQLGWYDAELQKDPYVVGAAVYCYCDPSDRSCNAFNVWPDLVQALVARSYPIYRRLPPVDPGAAGRLFWRLDYILARLETG